MLKIRLQRVGRINMPSYRLVVIEHARAPKAGNFVEKVGTYNPKSKERVLNADRIKYWISKGAQASGTVHNMLITEGIVEGKKINVLPQKHPPVKEAKLVPDAPAATPEAAPAASPAGTDEPQAESTGEAPEAVETPASTE